MIADALVWIGEHALAVSFVGVAALALGLAMYCAKEFPTVSQQEDEHARDGFI